VSKNIPFYFLVRSWNSFEYFDRCVESILGQQGPQFQILFVDDCSDYTTLQKEHIRKKLKDHIVVFNQNRQFAVRNAYEMIHTYVNNDEGIILNVDGDDWLIRDDVLDLIGKTYQQQKCQLTYGSSLCYSPVQPERHLQPMSTLNSFVNCRYTPEVEQNQAYRYHPFLVSHLRTWKVSLFKQIPKKSFLLPSGKWLRFCEDEAIFFPMLERSNGRYEVISTPLYMYNQENPRNDLKIHLSEKLLEEVYIRRQNLPKGMTPSSKTLYIKYSPFLSFPIIGNLLYLLQILIIKLGIYNSLFVSEQWKKMLPTALGFLSQQSTKIICQTTRLGFLIRKVCSPILLDISDQNELSLSDYSKYEQIMWSLVFSTHFSIETRTILPDLTKLTPHKKSVKKAIYARNSQTS
jgi:glycosyltransferase involved in cell wall biosynthesis